MFSLPTFLISSINGLDCILWDQPDCSHLHSAGNTATGAIVVYRKAKDKAAFRREHESQLILYEAAAKAIKDAGITRLPDLAALKAEYRELDKQKARLYEQYGEVKRELKEYGIIKQNVDSILRVTPGKEQAQEL